MCGAKKSPANVEVVIDEDGKLAVIKRFYVPWQ